VRIKALTYAAKLCCRIPIIALFRRSERRRSWHFHPYRRSRLLHFRCPFCHHNFNSTTCPTHHSRRHKTTATPDTHTHDQCICWWVVQQPRLHTSDVWDHHRPTRMCERYTAAERPVCWTHVSSTLASNRRWCAAEAKLKLEECGDSEPVNAF
jgi:hypothetical protein